jgi:ABC-type nickel/cobalt efflux system permease component RcnA
MSQNDYAAPQALRIPWKLGALIAVPFDPAVCTRCAMETVTIAASRGFTVSDMEMLIGSAIIVAVLAWMILSKVKHLRGRHQEPRV